MTTVPMMLNKIVSVFDALKRSLMSQDSNPRPLVERHNFGPIFSVVAGGCRVVLEVDLATGSFHLLDADRATKSTYL